MRKMPGGMGGGNMNNMLKQAQKMQAQMQRTQQEIAEKEFEVSAGGGAVTIKINGEKQVQSIALKPEIVDPDDVEMLQDILTAAVNEAIRTVDEYSNTELAKITGGMNLGF